MNTSLSFRKESIQRSSSMSESLNKIPEAMGSRAPREQMHISISTLLTYTQN